MSSPTADEAGLPLAELIRIDEACDRFEAALRSGQRPELAPYLAGLPEAARKRLLRELLCLDLEYRRDRGGRPDPSEYRARFPDESETIEAVFAQFEPSGRTLVSAPRAPGRLGDGSMPGVPSRGEDASTQHGEAMPRPDLSREMILALRGAGYEILGELGRGGMGVVYLAHKVALNRRCALKMILAGGLIGASASARFRAEAETIARLRHPDIVQIYHVGDVDGLPYLELEYLPGGSLYRRLDGTPWSVEVAAPLVEALARAIAEAHRQGIVHRDLKPANILLDRDLRPKVADFGLAKILDSDDGLTKTQAVLGSPSYMAPEQATGHSRLVGPTTDVYALGAIFYELLTGRPPFRAATAMETLVQVRETEPVPPSRLQPGLARAAEIICLKCLAKVPARRYPTAEALAEDLRRLRSGESILAHPAPAWEQAWRWARRRPSVAAAMGVAAAAIALFLGGTAYYNARLRQEARKAQAAEAAALAQRNLALNAFNQLIFNLQERLGNSVATRSTRRALLDTAIAGLGGIARGTEGAAPDLGLAVAHVKLGEIYVQIGRMIEARRQLDQARRLAERLAAAKPHDPAVAECLRDALAGLGAVAVHDRRLDDAKNLLRQVVALAERVARSDPASGRARRGRIEAYLELGRAHGFAGERHDAERSFLRMQDLAERWVKDEPGNLNARDLLASSYRKLADERKFVGDEAGARAHYLRALAIAREVHAAEPDNVVFSRHLATAADDLAGVARIQGYTDEARALFQEAQRLFAEQVDADPEDLESQFKLLRVETRYGTLERDELQFARAGELFRRALWRRRQLDQQEPFGARLGPKSQEVYLLEAEIAACAIASRELADLEAARTQSPAISCLLLLIRTRTMRKAGLQADALASAGALCDLNLDRTEDLYVQARTLAGCVRELDDSRWARPPTPDRRAMHHRCAEKAIATLSQALQRGLDQSPISGFEEVLAPLRGQPGYQELVQRLRDPMASPKPAGATPSGTP